MGKEILQRVEKEPTVPMFVTSSESDRAINHHEKGKTFDAAVSELDLVDKVIPDLSVLLALIDEKMIIDSYK